MKISIPDNVGGVSALLTTRKWEKAAIVWAYVHSSENQAHVKSDMKPPEEVPQSSGVNRRSRRRNWIGGKRQGIRRHPHPDVT